VKLILFFFATWVLLIYSLTFSSSGHTFFDYSYESDAMVADENTQYFWHLANFDGAHYQNIARFGYIKKFQAAFFPLFPLLTNIIEKITNNFLTSSLIVSIASLFISDGSLMLL